MKTDPLIKRLRWLMLAVMLVDLFITLLGQPTSYWTEPLSANEGNPLVRFFMQRGLGSLLLASLIYGAGMTVLVSVSPRGIGLPVLLAVTLWHYNGACTWLRYTFHLNYAGLMYGAFLSAALVSLGLGAGTDVFPVTRWRRGTKVLAVSAALVMWLGAGFYLSQARAEQKAQQQAHADTQRTIDHADFIGHFRAVDASFAILRAPAALGVPSTVPETEFPKFVRAATPTNRKVFIIYDQWAFPEPADRQSFESRIRATLQSSGATIHLLANQSNPSLP